MKLIDWLRPLWGSANDVKCIIWDEEFDDEPLYEGFISKIPWDVADSYFADLDKVDCQIEPRRINEDDVERILIIVVKYWSK